MLTVVSNNKVVREGEDKPGKPMALKHGERRPTWDNTTLVGGEKQTTRN